MIKIVVLVLPPDSSPIEFEKRFPILKSFDSRTLRYWQKGHAKRSPLICA